MDPGAGILLLGDEGRGRAADEETAEVALNAGDGGRNDDDDGVVKMRDCGRFWL